MRNRLTDSSRNHSTCILQSHSPRATEQDTAYGAPRLKHPSLSHLRLLQQTESDICPIRQQLIVAHTSGIAEALSSAQHLRVENRETVPAQPRQSCVLPADHRNHISSAYRSRSSLKEGIFAMRLSTSTIAIDVQNGLARLGGKPWAFRRTASLILSESIFSRRADWKQTM